jgi:hypothetical protein
MHFRTGFPSMKMHQAADEIALRFPRAKRFTKQRIGLKGLGI